MVSACARQALRSWWLLAKAMALWRLSQDHTSAKSLEWV